MRARLLAILALGAMGMLGPSRAAAQFDDVPTPKEKAAADTLALRRRACEKGDGYACYDLAQRVQRGELAANGNSTTVVWSLEAEACAKGYARACTEVAAKRRADSIAVVRWRADSIAEAQARVAEAQREAARRHADSIALVQAPVQAPIQAPIQAPKTDGAKPAAKSMSKWKALLIAGAGIAVAAADGEAQKSVAEGQVDAQNAMAATAQILGDSEDAAALSGSGTSPGAPSTAAATAGAVGSAGAAGAGRGFDGTWSYTGSYAAQVQYLLSRVTNWRCPASLSVQGAKPQVTITTSASSQRDQYVAAALTTAWAMECYARLGYTQKAAALEPTMRDLLDNADALCSGTPGVAGAPTPTTLWIWGCPPPIR